MDKALKRRTVVELAPAVAAATTVLHDFTTC